MPSSQVDWTTLQPALPFSQLSDNETARRNECYCQAYLLRA